MDAEQYRTELNRASQLAAAGDHSPAVDILARLMELFPQDPAVRCAAGWVHAQAGDLARGRDLAEEGVELAEIQSPEHVEVKARCWRDLGRVLEAASEYVEAAEAYERSLDLVPDDEVADALMRVTAAFGPY